MNIISDVSNAIKEFFLDAASFFLLFWNDVNSTETCWDGLTLLAKHLCFKKKTSFPPFFSDTQTFQDISLVLLLNCREKNSNSCG